MQKSFAHKKLTPFNFDVFFDEHFLSCCSSCLKRTHDITESTIPHFATISLRNFSLNLNFEPKSFDCKVIVSFVCESKVGFSMSALTKIHK